MDAEEDPVESDGETDHRREGDGQRATPPRQQWPYQHDHHAAGDCDVECVPGGKRVARRMGQRVIDHRSYSLDKQLDDRSDHPAGHHRHERPESPAPQSLRQPNTDHWDRARRVQHARLGDLLQHNECGRKFVGTGEPRRCSDARLVRGNERVELLAYGEREQGHGQHETGRGRDTPEQPPAPRSQDHLFGARLFHHGRNRIIG